jgi:hypothetical protein
MEILELVKTIVMVIAQLGTMLMLPMMVLLLIVYFSKWEESVKRGFFKVFIALISIITCCVFLMFVIHAIEHIG